MGSTLDRGGRHGVGWGTVGDLRRVQYPAGCVAVAIHTHQWMGVVFCPQHGFPGSGGRCSIDCKRRSKKHHSAPPGVQICSTGLVPGRRSASVRPWIRHRRLPVPPRLVWMGVSVYVFCCVCGHFGTRMAAACPREHHCQRPGFRSTHPPQPQTG